MPKFQNPGQIVLSALEVSKIYFPVKKVIMVISIISLSESFISIIRPLGVSHFRAFVTSESYKLYSSMYKLSKFSI